VATYSLSVGSWWRFYSHYPLPVKWRERKKEREREKEREIERERDREKLGGRAKRSRLGN
jgi:hypothetical protein